MGGQTNEWHACMRASAYRGVSRSLERRERRHGAGGMQAQHDAFSWLLETPPFRGVDLLIQRHDSVPCSMAHMGAIAYRWELGDGTDDPTLDHGVRVTLRRAVSGNSQGSIEAVGSLLFQFSSG